MAGCAVQRARKVQRGITVQLTLGCWLGDMADTTQPCTALRAPFSPSAWDISRCWVTCSGWNGSSMSERVAGKFPVRQSWCRSCCSFTRFMTTFRQHRPGGKWVCDIHLWGKPHSESSSHHCCSVGHVPALSCLPSSDNRVLLRKKCCLLQVALFSPIWSRNLLKCCCGMRSWLKFAGGWVLYRGSCS